MRKKIQSASNLAQRMNRKREVLEKTIDRSQEIRSLSQVGIGLNRGIFMERTSIFAALVVVLSATGCPPSNTEEGSKPAAATRVIADNLQPTNPTPGSIPPPGPIPNPPNPGPPGMTPAPLPVVPPQGSGATVPGPPAAAPPLSPGAAPVPVFPTPGDNQPQGSPTSNPAQNSPPPVNPPAPTPNQPQPTK